MNIVTRGRAAVTFPGVTVHTGRWVANFITFDMRPRFTGFTIFFTIFRN